MPGGMAKKLKINLKKFLSGQEKPFTDNCHLVAPIHLSKQELLSIFISESRMVLKTALVWLTQKACKLPLFFSFCGRSVITGWRLGTTWWLSQTHRHRATHHPPQHTRPPHTNPLTHSHTHTLSHTHTHTYTHTHPHTPHPEGSSLAQMIGSRLLMARVAAGRWWADQHQIAARLRLDRAGG